MLACFFGSKPASNETLTASAPKPWRPLPNGSHGSSGPADGQGDFIELRSQLNEAAFSPVSEDESKLRQEDAELARLQSTSSAQKRQLLEQAMSRKLGSGACADVYALPGFTRLLLRSARERSDDLKGCKIIDVEYHGGRFKIARNTRIGLPLAIIVGRTNALYVKNRVSYEHALSYAKFSVLRKIDGSHPYEKKTFEKIFRTIGSFPQSFYDNACSDFRDIHDGNLAIDTSGENMKIVETESAQALHQFDLGRKWRVSVAEDGKLLYTCADLGVNKLIIRAKYTTSDLLARILGMNGREQLRNILAKKPSPDNWISDSNFETLREIIERFNHAARQNGLDPVDDPQGRSKLVGTCVIS